MQLPVTSIRVGKRLREDMGDVQGLAESIKRFGLLHPIIVDDERKLIAGQRRLEAYKLLGMERIEVKFMSQLSDEEKREIELEENLRRKDLTPFEQDKMLLHKASQVAVAISSKLEETKASVGRKAHAEVPKEEIAKGLGIGVGSLVRAEQRVDTRENYPFMQAPNWKQYHVLEAREQLEKLPDEDCQMLASIASEPAVPPQDAIHMFRRMAEMKPAERAEVRRLYASDDRRDKSLAKTRLVELPPEPDPRTVVLASVLQDLDKCIRAFPNDPFTTEIESVVSRVKELAKSIKEAHNEKTGHNPGLS